MEQDGAAKLFQCFSENQRKWSSDKSHNQDKYSEIYIGEFIIKSSDCEKLLGIKIHSKLHFWWSCLRSM